MNETISTVEMIEGLQKLNKEIEDSKNKDIEELRAFAFDLLNTANETLAYHSHLKAPFFPLVKKHNHIITKYELFKK